MHQFFQFRGPQQPQQERINITPELQNNLIVIEIYNNWEHVLKLFFKMLAGEIKEINELETTWVSYLNSNGIDLRNYKNAEDFENKHLRALVAEQLKE